MHLHASGGGEICAFDQISGFPVMWWSDVRQANMERNACLRWSTPCHSSKALAVEPRDICFRARAVTHRADVGTPRNKVAMRKHQNRRCLFWHGAVLLFFGNSRVLREGPLKPTASHKTPHLPSSPSLLFRQTENIPPHALNNKPPHGFFGVASIYRQYAAGGAGQLLAPRPGDDGRRQRALDDGNAVLDDDHGHHAGD